MVQDILTKMLLCIFSSVFSSGGRFCRDIHNKRTDFQILSPEVPVHTQLNLQIHLAYTAHKDTESLSSLIKQTSRLPYLESTTDLRFSAVLNPVLDAASHNHA